MSVSRVILATFLATAVSAASAQSEVHPLHWEVTSIHLSDPSAGGGSNYNDQADGVTERNMSLPELISQAYAFSVVPFRDDQLVGLPGWTHSARYDISARVAPENVNQFKAMTDLSMKDTINAFSKRQYTGEMLMLQALLAERFHLRVHWENREQQVYKLTIYRGKLKLKQASDPAHADINFSQGHIIGKGVPSKSVASLLAIPVSRDVVDDTGLTGLYDIDLRFDPRVDANAVSESPDLFEAIREQLGLDLEKTRASVPVLVVDSVDRPTSN